MARRQRVSRSDETRLLVASQRRCCLCYYLFDSRAPRRGQIAHLNRNASDSNFDNLVWLCLEHHDEFDSRTSQSKGFTPHEIRVHRDRLYAELSSGTVVDPSDEGAAQNSEDAAALKRLQEQVTVQAKNVPRGPSNALALVVPASLTCEELVAQHGVEKVEEAFKVGAIFAKALGRYGEEQASETEGPG